MAAVECGVAASSAFAVKACFTTTMASAEHASIAARALSVEEELHPDRVTKAVTADGPRLVARFAAVDARNLRLAVGAYVDMASVVFRMLAASAPGEALHHH